MLNVGKCSICQKEFKYKTRGSRIYNSDFCSSVCYDFSTRLNKNTKCKVCSKTLIGIPSKSKYCSESCSNIVRKRVKQLKNKSREKICSTCHLKFEDAGKNNQKEFCSVPCLNMGQKARSYNIKPNQYFVMKKSKNCPTCKNLFDSSARIQCIDHCHTTGKVRGLICRKCNTVLGQIGDDIPTLERLVKYLEAK